MSAPPGYVFQPSHYDPPLGHPQLDVYLLGAPVQRIFDIASASFRVLAGEAATWLDVRHGDTVGEWHYRVTPGRFWLRDHHHKIVEGFSFGGDLHVTTRSEGTHCQLTSTAPLLELIPDVDDPERVIADETEALAAIARARWQVDDDEWLAIWAGADPRQLFIGCLLALTERLRHANHSAALASDAAAYAWVQRAAQSLRNAGQWPDSPATLEEIERSLRGAHPEPHSDERLDTSHA